MLSARTKKVIGDVRAARGRFLIMVAAIAISTSAVATILTAYTILRREMARNYLGTNPASAQLELERAVDDDLIRAVRQRPGIADAEATGVVSAKLEVARDVWLGVRLFVIPDFKALRIGTFRSESGAWPPPPGSMLVERTALPLTRAKVGEAVVVQAADGSKHSITIAGTVHNPALAPAWQEQTVYGFITPSTMAALGYGMDLHGVKIVVRDEPLNRLAIEHTTRALAAWMRSQGRDVDEVRIPPPGMHPHQTQMNGILGMLVMFSILALVLGAVLAASIIGGLLAEQVRQIAVMKAIGARSRQIIGIYAALVAALGGVSVMIGLPLGLLAGRGFASTAGTLLNFTIYSYAVPWRVIAMDVLLGIAVPLLLALVPIFGAARRTVREALSDYGVDHESTGAGRVDRFLARFVNLDTALNLAMRNAFRRRSRTLLSLSLLSVAGAMFIASLNLKAAWQKTLDDAAAQRRYDIETRLARPANERQVLDAISSIEGVRKVESWSAVGASAAGDVSRTYPDGGHGALALRSVPADSDLSAITVFAGRWLRPGERGAVVLNHMARAYFRNAKPGDLISVGVNHKETHLRVIGIIREILTGPAVYAPPDTYAAISGEESMTNTVRIALRDRGAVDAMSKRVEDVLEHQGIRVRLNITEKMMGSAQSGHVYILVLILMFMAVIMAAVGVLGLASAIGASVAERKREFGVMRAIGARSSVVQRVVVSEALFIGLLSWVMAVPLSLPFSIQIGNLVGRMSFQWPLPIVMSPLALGIWLGVVVVGSAAASAWPARLSARLTVRESLAYG